MAKGIMYINGQRVAFDGEKNVLAVIRKAGINMPTLCYYSDLSVYGACRMCVVEDDRGRIDASCSMEPRDGLSIQTNTARLLKYRRMIIELLLASHDRDCTVCEKSSACELRRLALRFGVRRVRFEDTREQLPLDTSSPSVVRDPNKCILCGDCVRTCEEIQGMNIIDFTHRSADLRVMPAFDQKLAETDCIGCGQCAAVCPTAAITAAPTPAASVIPGRNTGSPVAAARIRGQSSLLAPPPNIRSCLGPPPCRKESRAIAASKATPSITVNAISYRSLSSDSPAKAPHARPVPPSSFVPAK